MYLGCSVFPDSEVNLFNQLLSGLISAKLASNSGTSPHKPLQYHHNQVAIGSSSLDVGGTQIWLTCSRMVNTLK